MHELCEHFACIWNTRVREHNLRGLENSRILIKLLSFDMCRWKVEDEGIEDVHGAIVDHLPFSISRPLWRP